MPYTAADLIQLLHLEPLEHNIYRGTSRDIGSGRIFGGQVLAQALVAARRTVEEERPAHSVHGYFILAGDLAVPVVYFVDRLRDGRSFTTRQVTAIQHGRAIFNMSASFHKQEDGPEHQSAMPEVPPPEGLRTELELIRERASDLPQPLRSILTQDRPLDIRPLDPRDPLDFTPRDARQRFWVRAIGEVGNDPMHHQAVLAYASDYGPMGPRCARTASPCVSRTSWWRAWTTPSGSTGPSGWTSGSSTTWRARWPPGRAPSRAAPSMRGTVV
jgi:acyl-CoA thioesterase-2